MWKPDLSLPPRPPTPVQVSAASLPDTPSDPYRASRTPGSYSHPSTSPRPQQLRTIPPWGDRARATPAPPSTPTFRVTPPWRKRSARKRNNQAPPPWRSAAYATPSTYYASPPGSSPSLPASPSAATFRSGSPHPWQQSQQLPAQRDLGDSHNHPRGDRSYSSQGAMGKRSPTSSEPKKKAPKYTLGDSDPAPVVQESTPATKPLNPLDEYLELCVRTNKTQFSANEQSMLCGYLDATKEAQRQVVYYLAKKVPWKGRGSALTYKLVSWIHARDGDYALVGQLLSERLSDDRDDDDAFADEMMGLDEMDELMDCQIALDACKSGQDLTAPLAQLLKH
ncbi:hypothetical protein GGR53DRAFT_528343 [Hypoxylon sp. FL1150]|nr:hypothetical protein GGR53DRAFT_528343 [Hypoxylon sp. FL1150]